MRLIPIYNTATSFGRSSVSSTISSRVCLSLLLPWLFLGFAEALAQAPAFIEEIRIVGERVAQRQIAGAARHLDADALKRFAHTDIQRIVRQLPGVYAQIEDGYGLRPNIGMRGVATERSARITLLEDNVPIAPAPYSAPSAYYFPTVGRIAGIEVLTGPAAITQGPYTIGGALNMISTAIPEAARGRAVLEAGEDASLRMHAHYGTQSAKGFGLLVETHQWRSEGYQEIDRGGNSGLNLEDHMVKIGFAPKGSAHAFELKLQDARQNSEQSYLGLADQDFNADALRRYGLSALDRISTHHKQVIARYKWSPSMPVVVSLTYYDNRHERNWVKTEGLDVDGSESAASFERTSWSQVINAVNLNRSLGGLAPQALRDILHGDRDTPEGSVQVRSNAREYVSRGIQASLSADFALAGARHQAKVGFRLHEDEEDRLQRNSSYHQASGGLVLDDLGKLGNAGNRVQQAEALAIFVYDEITFGNWRLTPGLRYEDIAQDRTRWEIRAGKTSDPASRSSANLRDRRSNSTRVFSPGLGLVYEPNASSALFAGIHKGFTAPTNAPGVKQEEALNYEFGARWESLRLNAEIVFFFSDYDNILGVCTASSGTDCTVGDAFNGDAARVFGAEARVFGDLLSLGAWRFPAELSYTYSRGEFETDIADTDFFGHVSAGDPIPYLPSHLAHAVVGVVREGAELHLSASYAGDACTRASCGPFERIADTLVLDIAGSYALGEGLSLFARLENLTRELEIVGRQPYGARPNKDRTAAIGVRLDF